MAFDFPTNPPAGTMFGPPGGPVYQWDGSVWNAMPGTMLGYTSYADVPPSTPVQGQFWWNSNTGILYVWYDDGSSKQWVAVSGGMPASVKTARAKNFIVNPAGQISQEVGQTGITASGYFADQWVGTDNVATSTRTFKTTGSALRYQANVNVASLAAGECAYMYQPIEGNRLLELGWGAPGAVPVVFRFDANVAKAGIYALAFRNGANNRSYVHEFNLPFGVSKGLYCSIPGDVTGTWPVDNTVGLYISFSVCSGATFKASAADQWLAGNFIAGPNAQASLSLGFYEITNVGLYADPDNTGLPPPWQPPKYEDDQLVCLRYYERTYRYNETYYMAAGGGAVTSHAWGTPKRIAPTTGFIFNNNINTATPTISAADTAGYTVTSVKDGTNGMASYSSQLAANARM